jgi:NAD(P)-dependent dehydrogenase (short-subunit alcohol dehydrogenase family)
LGWRVAAVGGSGCAGLVTGASRGIGFHGVRAFLRMGCRVVASSRSLDNLARSLSGLGGDILFYQADLRRERDVEGLMDYVFTELGRLDYVFLSYGNPSREPLEMHEAAWSDWLEAFTMYVASTASIIRRIVRENPCRATLFVVSSFTVKEHHPELVVSDTARYGLYKLVRTASKRYPDKVRGLILELGSFETPGALETVSRIAEKKGFSLREYWGKHVVGLSPLGRTGRLEELEDLIVLLARAPEYLTGAVIRFDGGSACCIE